MPGCLFSDDFSDGDMSDWQTAGNAAAPVVEDSWMRLQAYGAYDYFYKEAYKDIGLFEGELEFKFNWKVYTVASDKGASRTFKVFENSILKFERSISDISYGSAEGFFDEVVNLSGNIRILFGLYGHTQPSPGSRVNYLYVTNICARIYGSPVSVSFLSNPSGAIILVDDINIGVGRASLNRKEILIW